MLWQQHAIDSGTSVEYRGGPFARAEWKQDSIGNGLQIGELDGRPICVSTLGATIAGKRVLFYECVSQLADYAMVDAWIKFYAEKIPHCNAMNFHNCLSRIGALK